MQNVSQKDQVLNAMKKLARDNQTGQVRTNEVSNYMRQMGVQID
jgi:hypothetical protein